MKLGKIEIILLVILALTLALRLLPIGYGLPLSLFNDEYIQVANALKMLEARTLFLSFSYLPPLMAYLLIPFIVLYGLGGMLFGVFDGLDGFKTFVLLNSQQLLIFNRILVALAGTLAVWLTYKLGRKIFGWLVGLIAALWLAVDFLHLHAAASGRFWIPLGLLMLLAVYSLWQLAKNGRAKDYYWSAVWIGLGFGLGFIPILLAPWLILAHLAVSNAKTLKQFFSKKLVISLSLLAALLVFFSLGNTHAFLRQFGRVIAIVLSNFGLTFNFAAIVNVERQSDILGNLKTIFGSLFTDLKLLWPFIALGLYFAWKNKIFNWFQKSLLFGFPLLYFLALIFFFAKAFHRFNVPVIPILLLIGAYGLVSLFSRFNLPRKNLLVFILAVGLIAPTLFTTAPLLSKYFVTDTRLLARDWIINNVPAGSRLIIDDDDLLAGLIKNKESIRFLLDNNPAWVNTKDKFLLTVPDEDYPAPSYFIYDWRHLDLAKLAKGEVLADYYLVSFWQRDYLKIPVKNQRARWLDHLPKYLTIKFYPTEKLEEIYDLPNSPREVDFMLKNIKRYGPFIEIYQIN